MSVSQFYFSLLGIENPTNRIDWWKKRVKIEFVAHSISDLKKNRIDWKRQGIST